MIIALKKLMKNIFYYFFSIFFFSSIVYANELDEELIDKKFNQIKTTEFCTTNEWNEIEFLLNVKGDYGKEEIETISNWKRS